MRTANAYGWYVFLPEELHIIWDGHEFKWSLDGGNTWYTLVDAIQYPNFSDQFDSHAPDHVKGYSPPFLTRTNDPDILQIWTGVFAKTRPGLGCYVRSPVNIYQNKNTTVLEGVIETDWWFGPLFSNIKFHVPGDLVIFRADQPFIQVQPFSKSLQSELDTDPGEFLNGLNGMDADSWEAYHNTVVRRVKTREKFGEYAVESRRRAREA